MTNKREVAKDIRNGIEIVVRAREAKESTGWVTKYDVYFSNTTGNFEDLHHFKSLRDIESKDEALAAGRKAVDDRRWQHVGSVDGFFDIYVRLWFNDRWGYSVRSGGSVNSQLARVSTREAAEAEARAWAQKELKRLDDERAEAAGNAPVE